MICENSACIALNQQVQTWIWILIVFFGVFFALMLIWVISILHQKCSRRGEDSKFEKSHSRN